MNRYIMLKIDGEIRARVFRPIVVHPDRLERLWLTKEPQHQIYKMRAVDEETFGVTRCDIYDFAVISSAHPFAQPRDIAIPSPEIVHRDGPASRHSYHLSGFVDVARERLFAKYRSHAPTACRLKNFIVFLCRKTDAQDVYLLGR